MPVDLFKQAGIVPQDSDKPTARDLFAEAGIDPNHLEHSTGTWGIKDVARRALNVPIDAAEVALGMASNAAAFPIGKTAGALRSAYEGAKGYATGKLSPDWGKKAQQTRDTVTSALTWKPHTETGRQALDVVGDVTKYTAGLPFYSAEKLGNYLTQKGYPNAGYLVQEAGEDIAAVVAPWATKKTFGGIAEKPTAAQAEAEIDLEQTVETPPEIQGFAPGAADAAFEEGDHPRDEGGKFAAGGKQKILDLCENALHGSNEKKKVSYASATKEQADRLKDAPCESTSKWTAEDVEKLHDGLDVEGYEHSIDNYSIRHMMSRHGNEKKEEKHGQIAVTREDIARIPEIVSNYDHVVKTRTDTGRPGFKYAKRINGVVYYLEEARTGKKELAAVSMRKRKR